MSSIEGNEQIRLARIEAVCDQLRAEMDDVLKNAYSKAVEEKDEDRAAELARKIRDKLLASSDKEMTFDRLGIDTSSTVAFLTSITEVFKNSWALYRQHLRDIPQQPGFPLNIDWGKAPGGSDDGNDD